MDPQPRVLLEVTWEAMKHARIDPTSLLREPVGVYVGIIGQEYGNLLNNQTRLFIFVASRQK